MLSTIERLPEPFSNITKLDLTSKIPRSSENIILTEWLHQQGLISSHSVKGNKIHIENYNNTEDL